MKKEELKNNHATSLSWWEKSVQTLKEAWKFANEFNLVDKIKNIKVPTALKISGLALLLSSKSLDAKAALNTTVKDAKTNKTEISFNKKNTSSKAASFSYEAAFRAYSGKYYNEICNGSPCWLASTYETNGAGIGKQPSSIAMWNDRGNYRGLNQISPAHAQKFLKWLGTQPQFKSVYQSLNTGGVGKANWQKTAKAHEHLMTEAFEWYMVEVYNADNFKAIQDKLNEAKLNVSLKKLHPAIISAMHQLMVESPSRKNMIANKIVRFMENHNGDAQKLNSEEFIKTLISNQSIQKRALALFNNKSVKWKVAQFDSLLAKVQPTNNDAKSWFDEQSEALQKKQKDKQTKNRLAQENLKDKSILNQHFQNILKKEQKLRFPEAVSEELKQARKIAAGKAKAKRSLKSQPVSDEIKKRTITPSMVTHKKSSERI